MTITNVQAVFAQFNAAKASAPAATARGTASSERSDSTQRASGAPLTAQQAPAAKKPMLARMQDTWAKMTPRERMCAVALTLATVTLVVLASVGSLGMGSGMATAGGAALLCFAHDRYEASVEARAQKA